MQIMEAEGLFGQACQKAYWASCHTWVTPSISIFDFVVHFCQVVELMDVDGSTLVQDKTCPATYLIAAPATTWIVKVGVCATKQDMYSMQAAVVQQDHAMSCICR